MTRGAPKQRAATTLSRTEAATKMYSLGLVIVTALLSAPGASQEPAAAREEQARKPTPIETTLEHIDDYVVRIITAKGSAGSGFLVVYDGQYFLVTAYHVVEGCSVSEKGCLFGVTPWYSSGKGKELWLSKELADELAKGKVGQLSEEAMNALVRERLKKFDGRIPLVARAFSERWDVAILEPDIDLKGHPFAPRASTTKKKYPLAETVYFYGKPFEVNGKYPGVLRKGVVGGYFDYGHHSRLLSDIRTTAGDSGGPVIHVDSGRIIGIGVGSIVKARKAEVKLQVEVGGHARAYDLSDEVSGVGSVIPYYYVDQLAREVGAWGKRTEAGMGDDGAPSQ